LLGLSWAVICLPFSQYWVLPVTKPQGSADENPKNMQQMNFNISLNLGLIVIGVSKK
jgi:hypothetical protein